MRKKSAALSAQEEMGIASSSIVSNTDLSVQFLEIQQTYGDNLPYQRERVVNETKFYMNQSATAMLEAGRRLILLKEHEPHGEFINVLENQLNIARRTASAMMKAAVKFLNLKNAKGQTFAHLGSSKLFELMTLDNEELEELAEGGTVAGITLDEVDKMSVRELKAALRQSEEVLNKERERIESLERISADKSKKIDELDTKLQQQEKVQQKIELEKDPRVELLETYKTTLNSITTKAMAATVELQQLFAKSQTEMLSQTFYQSMAIDVAGVRDYLNTLLDLLPSDTAPIDIRWLNQTNTDSEVSDDT